LILASRYPSGGSRSSVHGARAGGVRKPRHLC